MEHGAVTDGHTVAEDRRMTVVGVDGGQVLDVGVPTDADVDVLGPQHATEPDRCAGGDRYVPCDGDVIGDERVGVDGRRVAVDGEDPRHGGLPGRMHGCGVCT